jgi:hypothetical protein
MRIVRDGDLRSDGPEAWRPVLGKGALEIVWLRLFLEWPVPEKTDECPQPKPPESRDNLLPFTFCYGPTSFDASKAASMLNLINMGMSPRSSSARARSSVRRISGSNGRAFSPSSSSALAACNTTSGKG